MYLSSTGIPFPLTKSPSSAARENPLWTIANGACIRAAEAVSIKVYSSFGGSCFSPKAAFPILSIVLAIGIEKSPWIGISGPKKNVPNLPLLPGVGIWISFGSPLGAL